MGHCLEKYKKGNETDRGMDNIDELIKKAEQGDIEAQDELGYMYEHGEGVEQDYAKAIQWYEKAAAQGCQEAIEALEEGENE